MGPEGALRAAVEAREEGLVSFIGVTGHRTRVAEMHLRHRDQDPAVSRAALRRQFQSLDHLTPNGLRYN